MVFIRTAVPFLVIPTSEGRKDLGDIHFLLSYVPEIFHFVQDDKAVVGTLRAAFD